MYPDVIGKTVLGANFVLQLNSMRLVRAIIYLVVLALIIWATLVWGLPWFMTKSPKFCQTYKLASGFCAPDAFNKAQQVSEWTKKNMPLGSGSFAGKTLSDAYLGLAVLENAARGKLGDDKVEIALNSVDNGIKSTEIALNKQGFGGKIQDIPENAKNLLQNARVALEQLRAVFDKTQRRAEDVTNAVNNTKKALDALSSVLPSASPEPTKEPTL